MCKNQEHPGSFVPFMKETVQLVIEPHAALNEEDNPLSACHEAFSRFTFTVIKDSTPLSMNMRWVSDTPDENANNYLAFREMAELAIKEHLKAKMFPKKITNAAHNTPAFTLTHKTGKYTKGKTSAQVLKEDKDGRKHLEEQKDWLVQNLGRYSANQMYIDAIDEALNLSEADLSDVEASVSFTLFSSGIRVLEHRTNDNGKSLVYDGSITFIPGISTPLTVRITNFYAEINTDDKGLKQPNMKTKEDEMEGVIALNYNETLRLLEDLKWYYNIKNDELRREGIKRSEKALSEFGNSDNSQKPSTAANTGSEKKANKPKNQNSGKSGESGNATGTENANTASSPKEAPKMKAIQKTIFISSKVTKNGDEYSFTAKILKDDGTKTDNDYPIIIPKETELDTDTINRLIDSVDKHGCVRLNLDGYDNCDKDNRKLYLIRLGNS